MPEINKTKSQFYVTKQFIALRFILFFLSDGNSPDTPIGFEPMHTIVVLLGSQQILTSGFLEGGWTIYIWG